MNRRTLLGFPVALVLNNPLVAAARSQQPNLNELPASLPRPIDVAARVI
jgi:hypothetical protein